MPTLAFQADLLGGPFDGTRGTIRLEPADIPAEVIWAARVDALVLLLPESRRRAFELFRLAAPPARYRHERGSRFRFEPG